MVCSLRSHGLIRPQLSLVVGQTAQEAQPVLEDLSPLRHLPLALNPRQRYFLEAIRISAEFTFESHRRLCSGIASIPDEGETPAGVVSLLMLDAWSLVDAVHRLRALVSRMPGYRRRARSKQVFLRASEDVERLRHSIQHLDTDISELLKYGLPAFGALSWIRPHSNKAGSFWLESVIPGQLGGASPNSLIRVPEVVPEGVSQITLWATGIGVDLSALQLAVLSLARSLEGALRRQFAELPTGSIDTQVGMLVSFVDEASP